MEKYKPHIILSAAISIDGKIATYSGDSKLSSQKDIVRLHKLRSQVDGILVGKKTVEQDDPLLTIRFAKGKNPIRIILDSNGAISAKSNILKTANQVPTIIAVSKKISQANLRKLNQFPLEIIKTGERSVNIKSLMKQLFQRGLETILIEGGGTINWQFIKNNLFDEIYLTISPFIIGGTEAISFVQGKGFNKILQSPKLKLKSIQKLENHALLHYAKI